MNRAIPCDFTLHVDAVDSSGKFAIVTGKLVNDKGETIASYQPQRIEVGGDMTYSPCFAVLRPTPGETMSLEVVFDITEKQSKAPAPVAEPVEKQERGGKPHAQGK